MSPRYENSDGPPPVGMGGVNELELELHLQRVTLRDFSFEVSPLFQGSRFRLGGAESPDGLELIATARDTGLQVSLRFDRGEFVNIATAGLHALDAADAMGGGELL